MDEAKEAYLDMARVWHPDRFTDNPRLRKKAEEKLKEINVAYAEIKALLSTGPEILRTKRTIRWTQSVLTDLKQMFRQLISPKTKLGGVTNRRSNNNDSILRRAGHMGKSRDGHRNFEDIYEEIAKARKEAKEKMGGVK